MNSNKAIRIEPTGGTQSTIEFLGEFLSERTSFLPSLIVTMCAQLQAATDSQGFDTISLHGVT